MIRDTFKGFLLMRFFGFIPLVILVAVVLGIREIATGSLLLGVVILAAAVLITAAAASHLARHARRRPR